MLPDNLYKRRRQHNNTPPTILLVLTNAIVFVLMIQAFTTCDGVNNFFWAALAVLALYNVYTIRRNTEEYTRVNIIVYTLSIAVMILVFFYLDARPGNC